MLNGYYENYMLSTLPGNFTVLSKNYIATTKGRGL